MVLNSAEEFFTHFAISSLEMDSSLNAVVDGRDYQKPICVCGHPMMWHSDTGSRSMCSFANTYCRCQSPLAVITASDLRYFKKLTRGAGADHALSLGCYSALKAGKTVRWLAEPKCFKCKQVGASIKPVALNSLNRVAFASGEINVFLCANCYQELLFS